MSLQSDYTIEFPNPPLDFNDIRSRERKIREMLAGTGIDVKDCNIITQTFDHDSFKTCSPRMFAGELAEDLRIKKAYTLKWTLEMSDRMVCEMLELSKKLDEFHRRMCHYEAEALRASQEVLYMKNKNHKLKNVLQDNPGLKDQWDELMVMCKLAGLDENIV